MCVQLASGVLRVQGSDALFWLGELFSVVLISLCRTRPIHGKQQLGPAIDDLYRTVEQVE